MKTIVKMLAVAGMFLGASAFADDGGKDAGTVFFYQTAAGKQAVTGGLNYWDQALKTSNGNGTFTRMDIHAAWEYGINDMFSAGAKLGDVISGTNSVTGQSNTSASGLENIDLFFKGTYGLGTGTLKYGADLSWSTGDAELDTNGFPKNGETGGNSLTPYVGYQMGAGPGSLGAKIAYQFDLGDRTIDPGGGAVNVKVSGGDLTEIDLFYEWKLAPTSVLGFALMDQMYSNIKVTGGSGSNDPGSPFMGLKVYSDINLGGGELLPSLAYATCSDSKAQLGSNSVTGVTSNTYWDLDVDYRWTF